MEFFMIFCSVFKFSLICTDKPTYIRKCKLQLFFFSVYPGILESLSLSLSLNCFSTFTTTKSKALIHSLGGKVKEGAVKRTLLESYIKS
jgi:hypothetical protein